MKTLKLPTSCDLSETGVRDAVDLLLKNGATFPPFDLNVTTQERFIGERIRETLGNDKTSMVSLRVIPKYTWTDNGRWSLEGFDRMLQQEVFVLGGL